MDRVVANGVDAIIGVLSFGGIQCTRFFICMVDTVVSATSRLAVRITLIAVTTAMITACSANQTKESAKKSTAKEGCEWACIRWNELCTLDPRGVRQCRNVCDRFGEVCSE